MAVFLRGNAVDIQQGRKSYPLRLSTTLQRVVRELAERDGVSMNHFIEIAIAEKLARLQVGSREAHAVNVVKVGMALSRAAN